MCIAVYCYLCILYYHVTVTHDTTYIGNGDSNPGNGNVNNPLEEDMTGGGNICDVLFEGKCYVQDCTHPPQTYLPTHISVSLHFNLL